MINVSKQVVQIACRKLQNKTPTWYVVLKTITKVDSYARIRKNYVCCLWHEASLSADCCEPHQADEVRNSGPSEGRLSHTCRHTIINAKLINIIQSSCTQHSSTPDLSQASTGASTEYLNNAVCSAIDCLIANNNHLALPFVFDIESSQGFQLLSEIVAFTCYVDVAVAVAVCDEPVVVHGPREVAVHYWAGAHMERCQGAVDGQHCTNWVVIVSIGLIPCAAIRHRPLFQKRSSADKQ